MIEYNCIEFTADVLPQHMFAFNDALMRIGYIRMRMVHLAVGAPAKYEVWMHDIAQVNLFVECVNELMSWVLPTSSRPKNTTLVLAISTTRINSLAYYVTSCLIDQLFNF